MNKNHWKSECLKWWYHRWILLTLVALGLLIPIFALVLNTPSSAPNAGPSATQNAAQDSAPSVSPNAGVNATWSVGQAMEIEKCVVFVSNQLLQSFYLGR